MKSIVDRRIFFKVAASGVAGCMISPMRMFAEEASGPSVNVLSTAKNVIFIMLGGAPSHTDTFDLKVGSWTPENFAPTTINGLDWPSGLLPRLGEQLAANRVALVRSCQAPALVHSLLQTWSQIGRSPTAATGKIAPNIGSIVALEKEPERKSSYTVPGFLSFNGGSNISGPGYFPGKYSSFDVSPPQAAGIANITHPDGGITFNTRYGMLEAAEHIQGQNPSSSSKFDEMRDFYSAANAMMGDPRVAPAFRFTAADSARYNQGNAANGVNFGNACLTARNVLQADLGVRYIQINLGGWDNHANIYAANGIYSPARMLDSGLGNLIEDLASLPGSRGTLLDDTLIVVRGEFGRTVGALTPQAGRDHYFTYSSLMAGGGIRGGRAIGSTTPNGAFVDSPGWEQDRPITSEDIAATIYSAVGVNYRKVRWDDPLGRGFEYVASSGTNYIGEPIADLFR